MARKKQIIQELVDIKNNPIQDTNEEHLDKLVQELVEQPKEEVVEAPTPTRKVVKTKRTGVGAFVVETIKSNIENKVAMTNDQILQMVKDKFGDEVKTTKACIAWYQSKVRGEYI